MEVLQLAPIKSLVFRTCVASRQPAEANLGSYVRLYPDA